MSEVNTKPRSRRAGVRIRVRENLWCLSTRANGCPRAWLPFGEIDLHYKCLGCSFTRVNECFSSRPQEFMRSLYLLTLPPGSSDTSQLNVRRNQSGYALKLSDLWLICRRHLRSRSGCAEALLAVQRSPLLTLSVI